MAEPSDDRRRGASLVTGAPVLEAWALRRVYPAVPEPVVAVDGLDLAVAAGRFVVLAGRSGSGKSTLLRVLAAIDRPDAGTVHVDGIEIGHATARARRRLRRTRLGIVLPRPSDNLLAHRDAAGNLRAAARWRGARISEDAVAEPLERVGLAGRSTAHVAELSGGEQQRLAFAVAVTGAPAVVLADEPTAELDAVNAIGLVAVLRSLADGGVTLVVASHDPHVIDAADDVVRLDGGRRV